MTIRVDRDGQIVPLVQGYTENARTGEKVALGYNEVMEANGTLEDGKVSEDLLQRIKDGEVSGLTYFDDDTAFGGAPGSPEPDKQGGNGPAFDEGGGARQFDPDEVNQEAVLNYLKTADPAEVERVKAAEAEGQNRKKISEFEPEGGDE